MNKLIVFALCVIFTITACSDDKNKQLTESEVHARVDSLVGVKMEELSKQAMEDLDHRMSIEVKAKADSIVAAKTGKIDTTQKPTPPQPGTHITHQTIFHKK